MKLLKMKKSGSVYSRLIEFGFDHRSCCEIILEAKVSELLFEPDGIKRARAYLQKTLQNPQVANTIYVGYSNPNNIANRKLEELSKKIELAQKEREILQILFMPYTGSKSDAELNMIMHKLKEDEILHMRLRTSPNDLGTNFDTLINSVYTRRSRARI